MHKFLFVLIVSLFACQQGHSKKDNKKVGVDFARLELINKVMHLVEKNYYLEVEKDVLIEGALKGIMDALDEHSNYLDVELFKKMREDTQGEFGGIGVEVSYENGSLKIISAIEDTPAFKAGIKGGDQIVEINKENILRLSVHKAIEKMQGKVGENIRLGIKRVGEDEILHFNVKREIIKVQPVKSRLIEDGYAILRLVQFQVNSEKFLRKALSKIRKKSKIPLKGIILDLRGNPGGLLDEAVNVASIFLEKGVVVSTESRDPNYKDIRYVRKSGEKILETPLVVLLDRGSASASEIVSGALQDYKRAKILGEKSYGKGTVQSVTPLDKDTAIKLTISQYLTPNKRKIHKKGIKPDVELKSIDRSKERSYLNDSQVPLALDYLKKMQ